MSFVGVNRRKMLSLKGVKCIESNYHKIELFLDFCLTLYTKILVTRFTMTTFIYDEIFLNSFCLLKIVRIAFPLVIIHASTGQTTNT